MDEKIFNLLEKMYVDLTGRIDGLSGTVEGLSRRVDVLNDEMYDMRTEFRQDFVRLENKMDENFSALYDGYKQCIEGIGDLRGKVDGLTDKVEHQEIHLQVIKGSK